MPNAARKHQNGGSHEGVTVPAPLPEGPSDAAEYPTAVPDYDVQALAAAASLERMLPRAAASQVPLDLSVPVRTHIPAVAAPLRAAFLLSHVDNRTSIGEIAMTAQIPVAEAIESFLSLAQLGAVELRGAAGHPCGVPEAPIEADKSRDPLLESTVRQKS